MLKNLLIWSIISILTINSVCFLTNAISIQENPMKPNDTWSGLPCIVCVYFTGMTEQLSIVYNQAIDKSLENLCNYLPEGLFRSTCVYAIEIYGDVIINGFYSNETPDVICNLLNFCTVEYRQCHIFPEPKKYSTILGVQRLENYLIKKNVIINKVDSNICDNFVFARLCNYLKFAFTFRNPVYDLDGDGHSDHKSLRGSDWKGKDCNDYDSNIRPGRKPDGDDFYFDTNCNGIYGKNLTSSISYEEQFCKNSNQIGLAVFGDSISAHFHIPEEWMDAETMNSDSFENLAYFLENELDWPQLSYITGYMNSTWHVTQGPTRSIYLNLFARNRCNHRDYQNIGVNGAYSQSVKERFSKSLKRNQKDDFPLLVYYSLVGNDVCNGDDDTLAHMTKPDDFRENIISTLKYLDTVLPNGSHVLLTGLANGTILNEVINSRIHPIGRVKNNVKYSDFYTYLSCLKLSPCNGWMTSNATLSRLTTDYAHILSGIVKNISQTYKFNNFDTAYIDLPTENIFQKWKAMGRELWELIEPIDGFHMNQDANALLADEIWSILETQHPDWLGNINPYNNEILRIFEDQGGY